MEGSPGNKVNLAKELSSGKGVIIGVPAAFSEFLELENISKLMAPQFHTLLGVLTHSIGPACSETHIPGYINSSKLKSAGKVFVVAVNDAFVYVSQTLMQPASR